MNALDAPAGQLTPPLRLFAALLFPLLVVLAFAAPAVAQDNGVVTGTVVNQTTGEPVPDVDVTLSKFADQTGRQSEDTTTQTDTDGTFRFDELDTSDGLAYAVSTRYLGVLYATTMILLSNEPEQSTELAVYETTTDQSVVTVTTRGLIVTGVDRETGELSLTDAYTLSVAGDRTLVEGNDGYSLRFPVAENVAGITPRPGFNFGSARIEETSVLVTTPLLPGETNAGLDYVIRYTGGVAEVPVTTAYPLNGLQILIPAGLEDDEIALDAEGTPLLDGGVVAIGEREFHVWSASGLDADETLTLSFTGLPAPPESHQLSTAEPALVAAFAVIAATAVTGWLVVSRGLHKPRPVVLAPAAAAPLDQRREQLSDDLRALEAAHQAGEVDDASYTARRRAILEGLRSISRQYRGLGDDE